LRSYLTNNERVMCLEQKKPFQRLSIDHMKAMQEQTQIQKLIEEATRKLDEQINEKAEELAQKLVDIGYDVDSFHIAVETRIENSVLIANLLIVQLGETHEFTLGGE
jgi:hypothetical protein